VTFLLQSIWVGFTLFTVHEGPYGEYRYSPSLFLDLGTGRGRGQRHAAAVFYPVGKIRYPLYKRLCGPQDRSGQVRKISSRPGFDPRTVKPVASRYTDLATRPTLRSVYVLLFCDETWVSYNRRKRDPTWSSNYLLILFRLTSLMMCTTVTENASSALVTAPLWRVPSIIKNKCGKDSRPAGDNRIRPLIHKTRALTTGLRRQ
jgi:hypothetical protein